MSSLITFSIDEYKKLLYQTKTKVIIALSVLYAVAAGVGLFIAKSKTGVEMVAPGRLPVFILELITGFILPVLTIFIGSELFTAEFKDATIKNLFALPVTKSIIYLGKLIAGAAMVGTCLLTMGISGIIVNLATNGAEAITGIGGMLVSYLGAFIFLSTILVIVSFFTLITGSPNMAIIINLLIWFVTGVAGTFLSSVRQFLPTSFSDWYQPLVNGTGITMALPALLYMLSYCIIFGVTGLLIFEKKEV